MKRVLSLDQLLEEALTGVYRAWFTLPRRSTLPEVQRLRGELAARLAALPQPVDLAAYERALIDFGITLAALPGAREAGGEALADLVRAEPTGQRKGFGPLLSATDATPARVEALVALLRLPDPPGDTIRSLNYAPEQAPSVWRAVWEILDARRAELPPAELAEIEAIRRRCEAAVGAASGAMQRQAAIVAGLTELEQVPAVIRMTWRVLLASKYQGKAPVWMHGAKDDFNIGHIAQSLPELPQSASEPPLPPPPPAPPEAPPPVEFFTDVRFPPRVKRGEVQWLSVQLTVEANAESVAPATLPVSFAPTPPGQLAPPEYVEVRLVAPGFSEVTGVWERTMLVFPTRDSQPVVFLLSADKVGARRLSLDFLHRGRMIGTVAFKSEVVEGSAPRGAGPAVLEETEEKPRLEAPGADSPPPADLELRVVRTAQANGLSFVLTSTHPELPLRAQPLGQITLTEKNPQEFFTRRLERLSELAGAAPGGPPEGDDRVVREIEALGEGLFELLIPPELQAVYWQQIKPLVEAGKIKTLLINSDEPWIPWELIKPYRWNDATDSDETAAFLVEQFTLSRWLARPLPPAVAVKTAALVMPDLNLANVQEEREFFTTLAQERRIALEGPLDERQEVLDRLRLGNFQVLHFATHGIFDKDNAERSELSLADGVLTPGDLMGGDLRGMRAARPLVFLNACHSGQVALSLVGLGGWAEKFFREARASAFVGTLWEVGDELAADFTRTFYTSLADGQTLGEALRSARLQIRSQEPANPTWLAYALYGDPNGKVTFG